MQLPPYARPINIAVKSEGDRFSPVPRLINCEAEDAGTEAMFRYPTYVMHGLTEFATLTNGGAIRGVLKLQNKLYVVSGQKFFSVDTAGSIEEIGGIPGNDRVYIAANRRSDPQMMLVTNGLVYKYQSGVFSQFDDKDLPPPVSVHFLNGSFIYMISDGRMFSSDLESAEINALSDATAESDRDDLLVGMIRGRELFAFGPETIEFWRHDGGNGFPFSFLDSNEQGCLSGKTVASVTNTDSNTVIIWVDKEGVVRMAAGYVGQDVCTPEIKRDIANDPDQLNLEGFTYSNNGVAYYVLSGVNFTWILNLKTGFWHKAESYGSNKWRGLYSVKFAGKTIIGDRQTNKLYFVDNQNHTEDGHHHIWKVRSRLLHDYPGRIEMNALYLNFVTGQGDDSLNPHNANPLCMMKLSKDMGWTWGPERQREVGQSGQRDKRVKFTRLGTSKEDGFAIEISMSAAVAGGINGAAARMKKITS